MIPSPGSDVGGSSSNVGAIAGGVIVFLIALAVVSVVLVFLMIWFW